MGIFNFDLSPEAELRREKARMDLEEMRSRRISAAAEDSERSNARARVEQGINDVSEMASKITQDKVQMARLEKQLPMLEQSAGSSPAASEALMMARVKFNQLSEGIDTLERTMAVRKAILPYEMISAGLARQKSVDVIDALNGLAPRDQASEPMVKVKSKRKGQEFGDEDEVSYEVPASIADRFIQGGGVPLPSSVRQQPAPAAQPEPINFSTYSTPMFGNAAPTSMGEQPVESSMLFGGSAPQATKAANPFITTRQPTYPEGAILRQGGKRYKVINGTPTEIP